MFYRFRANKEIKANAHDTLTDDGETVSLTIKGIEMNDAGSYRCEASNKLGSVKTESKLEVQGQFR